VATKEAGFYASHFAQKSYVDFGLELRINRDRNKAEGEAEDISHAEPWSHTTLVRAGGFEDCASATVTVVAVGAGLKPGETRLDLLRNGPGITSRSSRNQDQVVARSPDLATWPTEGLQPQARRETYGPADGGVWRPAPNRQLEIRKLFPARSLG